MKKQLLTSLMLTGLLLSGCGGSLKSTELPAAQPTSAGQTAGASPSETTGPSPSESLTPTASNSETTSSASPLASASPTGQPQSAEEAAYQAGLASFLPEADRASWAPSKPISETFDSDAYLSYIQVSSPSTNTHQVLFYRNGTYIGRATSAPFNHGAEVQQAPDGALLVKFRWPKDGENPSTMSGSTTGVYTLDENTKQLINTGNIPTHHYQTVDQARQDVPNIYERASRGVPSSASRLGDKGALQSPSQQIRCNIDGTAVYCSIADYGKNKTYGEDKNVLGMSDNQTPASLTSGEINVDTYTTLGYGRQALIGDYVFSMNENGLTAWSSTTGKGFYVNRDTYHTFG